MAASKAQAVHPLQAGQHPPRLSNELREKAALRLSLLGIEAILVGAVGLALWRATARAMESTNAPTPHSGSFASLARTLRGCRAPCRILEFALRVHEEGPTFS